MAAEKDLREHEDQAGAICTLGCCCCSCCCCCCCCCCFLHIKDCSVVDFRGHATGVPKTGTWHTLLIQINIGDRRIAGSSHAIHYFLSDYLVERENAAAAPLPDASQRTLVNPAAAAITLSSNVNARQGHWRSSLELLPIES